MEGEEGGVPARYAVSEDQNGGGGSFGNDVVDKLAHRLVGRKEGCLGDGVVDVSVGDGVFC